MSARPAILAAGRLCVMIGVAVASTLLAQADGARQAAPASYFEFTGTYQNDTYGYSVDIPSALTAKRTRPPAPAHGFFISLSDDDVDRIDVDGSFNTLMFSAEAAVEFDVGVFAKRCSNNTQVQKDQIRLGSLVGSRAVARCQDRVTQQTLLFETYRAVDPAQGRVGTLFGVALVCRESRCARGRATLREIADSFRLTSR
jgi:hypothetical protein